MSVNISFSDVLLIDEFKGLRELDLLDVKMDSRVLPYLHQLGLNKNDGYEVVAYKHRNLQSKVVVGFMYSGNIRTDEEFRRSKLCTLMDRVIMSSKKDFSLTKELCTMMGGNSSAYSNINEDNEKSEKDYLELDLYEEDYEQVEKQLEQLRSIIKFVRGNPYGNDGSLKREEEYLKAIVK